MRIYAKREVKRPSLEDLMFHRHIPSDLISDGAVTPRNFPHHTIAATDLGNVNGGLSTIAELLRLQHDDTPESIHAHVRDVDIYGKRPDGSRIAIGLRLEPNEALKRDHDYFNYLLGKEAVNAFAPHVTLLFLWNPSIDSTSRAIEWVERRAPTIIQLGRVSVRVGVDTDLTAIVPRPRQPFEETMPTQAV